jgi:hypothetical protein
MTTPEYVGDRQPSQAGHLPYDGPPNSGCTLPGHQGCTVFECRPAPPDEPVEVRHFCGKTTRHHPHIGCNGFGLWAGPGSSCERIERHVPHRSCDGLGKGGAR